MQILDDCHAKGSGWLTQQRGWQGRGVQVYTCGFFQALHWVSVLELREVELKWGLKKQTELNQKGQVLCVTGFNSFFSPKIVFLQYVSSLEKL